MLVDPLFAAAVAAVPADRSVLVDPKEKGLARLDALVARLVADLVPRERFVVSTTNPRALDALRSAGIRTWRTVRNPRELRSFLKGGPIADEAVTVRHVEPAAGGSTLTDRISFVPRIAWLGPLFYPVFWLAFALRHRNLRRIFGGLESR